MRELYPGKIRYFLYMVVCCLFLKTLAIPQKLSLCQQAIEYVDCILCGKIHFSTYKQRVFKI